MAAPTDATHFSATQFSLRSRTESATAAQPARKPLKMRKYSIKAVTQAGDVKRSDQIGPAMPIFEAAFSAFAHGTIIATDEGPVAVEDLMPGMRIMTMDDTTAPLIWVGAMTLIPRSVDMPEGGSLTRITSDSFGPARPHADLLAGPGARLLLRRPARFSIQGDERPLTPASKIADGMNAIEIVPPTPLTTYHLCLPKHAIVSANGMDVESFHPGAGFERNMGPNMLALFMSFFPHVKDVRDFGPLAHPRLPFDTFDSAAELA
ncbi:MAG: Hint domain-containing protein [Pseudomonadota bacterium]